LVTGNPRLFPGRPSKGGVNSGPSSKGRGEFPGSFASVLRGWWPGWRTCFGGFPSGFGRGPRVDEVLRVLRLLKEGRIGREEAERLLAALGVGSSSPEGVRRWLRIEGGVGKIQIRPAPGDEVSASGFGAGEVSLETDAEGGVLKVKSRGPKLLQQALRVEVKLPRDYGVELQLGQGSIYAESLAGLRGALGLGKVEATGIRTLDLELGTGSVRLGLLLDRGEHRLELGMGDAQVFALPGASFRIEGEAGLGRAERRVFGGGEARLFVHLGMGRLRVEA